MYKFVLFFIIVVNITCYRLAKKVYVPKKYVAYIPYRENDICIFKSNKKNSLDTFIVNLVEDEAIGRSYPNFSYYMNKTYTLFKIGKNENERNLIGLGFSLMKNDYVVAFRISFDKNNKISVYDSTLIYLDNFIKMPKEQIIVNGKSYSDVIHVDDKYSNNFYWSISNGYIKFLFKDDTNHELVRLYNDKRFCDSIRNAHTNY